MSGAYGTPGDRPEWLAGLPEDDIAAYENTEKPEASNQVSVGTSQSPEFGGGGSRPPKTNCTNNVAEREAVDNDGSEFTQRYWWRRKNELLDRCLSALPKRMARPAAVRERQKLREDCVRYEGDYAETADDVRSKSMSEIVREFADWYNGYRFAHLRFRGPDGDLVRAPLENSHQPHYGDRYYARFKGLERQMLRDFENPQTAMLTFTGSSTNDLGEWRCNVDHLRDVIDSWRPDRGRGVYHALRDALDCPDVDKWEYAIAVEHHKSGYGHVHVGIFADGDLSEKMFRPVIDRHLELCDIAYRDSHDYHHPKKEKRPISVNPLADDAEDGIANMASYLAEYIGAGERGELFDRAPEEIMFRAATWASTTQRVRFSTGANEMIASDLESSEYSHGVGAEAETSSWYPGTTQEQIQEALDDPERSPNEYFERTGESWTLDGIGRVDSDGESVFEVENKGVEYVPLSGAESLDPPKKYPADRPKPRTTGVELGEYSASD